MDARQLLRLKALTALSLALAGCPQEDASSPPRADMAQPSDLGGADLPDRLDHGHDSQADLRDAPDSGSPRDQDQGPDQGPDLDRSSDMAASDMTATARGALRVATWNISYLDVPDRGDRYRRTPEDYALLRTYVERLSADLVALQEVRGVAAVHTIFPADRWEAVCEDRTSSQNVCFALRKASGWTMQRLPDVVELRAGNPSLRAGLDVLVTQRDRAPLRLLNVHLKADCYTGQSAAGCASFFAQIEALETWIDARALADEAFIVLGDLNRFLTADDPAWLELDDQQPAGADLTRAITSDATPCWGGMFSNYIDHIILGAKTTPWLKRAEQLVFQETDFQAYAQRLSDHCPIWADLDVP